MITKHWSFRQLAVCILLVASCVIAVQDSSSRDRFFELVAMALAGYFGQMNPQGK